MRAAQMCFIEQQNFPLFSSCEQFQHEMAGSFCLQDELSYLNTLHSTCSRLSILSSSANMSSKRFFWACMPYAQLVRVCLGACIWQCAKGCQQLELYRVGDACSQCPYSCNIVGNMSGSIMLTGSTTYSRTPSRRAAIHCAIGAAPSYATDAA